MRYSFFALTVSAVLALSPVAHATLSLFDVLFWQAPAEAPLYTEQRLAKAEADECFTEIGVDQPPIDPDGSCSLGTPKTNQSYVWGLTQAGVGQLSFPGDELWFGTAANPLCTVFGSVFGTDTWQTASWVCEYGESALARDEIDPVPPLLGDWRAPMAYSYDLGSGTLTDRTPPADPNDPSILETLGIRSAGSLGSLVLLAGPSLTGDSFPMNLETEGGWELHLLTAPE